MYSERVDESMKESGETDFYRYLRSKSLKIISNHADQEKYNHLMKLIRNDSEYEKVYQEISNLIASGLLKKNEQRNLAIYCIAESEDFELANTIKFLKGDSWLREVMYQPLKDGQLPKNAQKWEQVILDAYLSELNQNRGILLESGGVSASNPYLCEMWLAKYGNTRKTKQYLLNMPFEMSGMLYIYSRASLNAQDPWPVFFQERIQEVPNNWFDWYLSYVIKPADLEDEFSIKLNEISEYYRHLNKALDNL